MKNPTNTRINDRVACWEGDVISEWRVADVVWFGIVAVKDETDECQTFAWCAIQDIEG